MKNTFLPLIFRMKHIRRWGLMHNTQNEDLLQHTVECAFIVNYLAIVGNRYFGKAYDVDKLTVCALFHDTAEVFTGDLPTPVKYFNNDMRNVYGQIEKAASEKLKKNLPPDLRPDYDIYLDENNLSDDERKLIKIADKLCAYIKCVSELNAGNKEFQSAFATIQKQIENIESEELNYFLDNCLASFSLSLDELKGTL